METTPTTHPTVSKDRIRTTRQTIAWFLRERGCTQSEDIAATAVNDVLQDINRQYATAGYFERMAHQRAGKYAKKLSSSQLRLPLSPQPVEELYDRLNDANLVFPSAEEEMFATAAREALITAIRELTPKIRFTIMNLFIYGLTQEEAAFVIQCSARSVRRYQIEGLAILRSNETLRDFFVD